MEKEDLLKSRIGLKLVAIGKMSKIFALQRFSEENHEISPEQFSVLAALAENDGLHQSQLGQATMKDKANITRIINILETNGLVRRSSEVDKRKVNKIYITEKGINAYKKILPTILDIWQSTIDGISPAEIEVMLKVLAQIRQNLDEKLILREKV